MPSAQFALKALLRHRRAPSKGSGGYEYLVQWDGVDPETGRAWEPTWEPTAYISPVALEGYFANLLAGRQPPQLEGAPEPPRQQQEKQETQETHQQNKERNNATRPPTTEPQLTHVRPIAGSQQSQQPTRQHQQGAAVTARSTSPAITTELTARAPDTDSESSSSASSPSTTPTELPRTRQSPEERRHALDTQEKDGLREKQLRDARLAWERKIQNPPPQAALKKKSALPLSSSAQTVPLQESQKRQSLLPWHKTSQPPPAQESLKRPKPSLPWPPSAQHYPNPASKRTTSILPPLSSSQTRQKRPADAPSPALSRTQANLMKKQMQRAPGRASPDDKTPAKKRRVDTPDLRSSPPPGDAPS